MTTDNAQPVLTATVFTKNDCSSCNGTKDVLNRKGVPHRVINVEEDLEPRAEFGDRSPLDYVVATYGRQMPVVVITDTELDQDDAWTGGRIDKLLDTVDRFEAADLLIPEEQRQS